MRRTKFLPPFSAVVLIVGFLSILILPSVGMVFRWDPFAGLNENRRMSARPVWGFSHSRILEFTRGFENYFGDRFGFRQTLISAHNYFKVVWLKTSTNADVTFGKEGWLYNSGGGDLENYRNLEPLDSKTLNAWASTFRERSQWAARNGIHYLVVIVPSAHRIYPEYLPAWILQKGSVSRMEQLNAALIARGVPVAALDLVLKNAKTLGRLYNRTDTHWNELGGWVGYREILNRIPGLGLRPRTLEEFDIHVEAHSGGDLANVLGLKTFLPEERIKLNPKQPLKFEKSDLWFEIDHYPNLTTTVTSDLSQGPNAVVFGDSFTDALMPFLALNFKKTVYFLKQPFRPEAILEQKPVVVIDEFVDRYLMTKPPKGMTDNIYR